jgi:hypothetical protein
MLENSIQRKKIGKKGPTKLKIEAKDPKRIQ